MRNTQESGQILRSKKRPRRTLRSGRGSRTNSNTSHQIPARVIEADSARAVWVPDPRSAQLIQPGEEAAVITHGASFQGNASVIWRAIHSAVGWVVTLIRTRSRRTSRTM